MTAFHLSQPDDVVTRPDATEPTATPEELPLFAVMAVYQDADFPGADQTGWDGEEAHVRRAFAYFHELGEQEAARRLRVDVIRRSMRQRPPDWEKLLPAVNDQRPCPDGRPRPKDGLDRLAQLPCSQTA